MAPSVAAGNIWIGGKRVIVSGTTVTVTTANPSLGRIDVVCVDDSGVPFVVAGSPSASPEAPRTRDDVLLLARLTVTANDTNIAAADITDLRDFGGFTVDGTSITISANGVISVNGSSISGLAVMVASGSGTTTITGNGANQNVFTDTFTAPANGDVLVAVAQIQWGKTLGADTPTVILTLGSTTVYTNAAINDANVYVRSNVSTNSVNSGRGFILTEEVTTATPTGAGALLISQYTTALNATLNSITLTLDPLAGTNGTCSYVYYVMKYPTGV